MIRKILDYSKINEDILDLLVQKYPYGYDEDDIITFRNINNELIEAIEIKTEDTIYLVKVGKRLVQAMEDFNDDDNDESTDDDSSDINIDDLDTDEV